MKYLFSFSRGILAFFGIINIISLLWFSSDSKQIILLSYFIIGVSEIVFSVTMYKYIVAAKKLFSAIAVFSVSFFAILIINQFISYTWVDYGVVSLRCVELAVFISFTCYSIAFYKIPKA